MCGIGLLAAMVGKSEQLTQFGPLAANSGEASQTAHIGTIDAPRLMRAPQKRHFLVLHQNLAI